MCFSFLRSCCPSNSHSTSESQRKEKVIPDLVSRICHPENHLCLLMNSTVDHLVLHVRKRGSISSPIYLSLCCRSSYSLTCHCVTSSLRLLLFSSGACHSLYFSITFTSFDALLLVSGCGSLATVFSTVCCFAWYLSPVAYLSYSLLSIPPVDMIQAQCHSPQVTSLLPELAYKA